MKIFKKSKLLYFLLIVTVVFLRVVSKEAARSLGGTLGVVVNVTGIILSILIIAISVYIISAGKEIDTEMSIKDEAVEQSQKLRIFYDEKLVADVREHLESRKNYEIYNSDITRYIRQATLEKIDSETEYEFYREQ